MGERLTEIEVSGQAGWGHITRYRLAAGFCEPGDTIVDAACGIGYGAGLMPSGTQYIGVDLLPVEERIKNDSVRWVETDLQTWEPDTPFDVAISFETIEHLEEYKHFLQQLQEAQKWVICSVPVIPTVHMNEWHKHDFAPLELPTMFDDNWVFYQYLAQPQEFSEIYVFQRK